MASLRDKVVEILEDRVTPIIESDDSWELADSILSLVAEEVERLRILNVEYQFEATLAMLKAKP